MINNNLIAAASFSPKSVEIPNAWVGHLPFAAWMIQEVSPKIFVELGTHSGNSYFSFCQSIVEAGISSKCYAVDTWQGDVHAGQYDEETFIKIDDYHKKHYADFSRLLRMTFDDAVSYFSDESIDVLHIDGLHTYDAVRHDFETWLPKLAPGAIVMFHDTNVRERNFGVWKLWEELQSSYPNNLEFLHSNGLGVLQLTNAPDSKKLDWLQPESHDQKQLIKYFSVLGSRQLERFDLDQLKQHVTNVNRAVAERDGQIGNLHQLIAERDGQITGLNQEIIERDRQIVSLNPGLESRDQQIINLNQAIVERDEQITNLNQAVVERDGQIDHINRAATEYVGQIAHFHQFTNLNQSAVERDQQITNLNQLVAERDKQITYFRQIVDERDEQLAHEKRQVEKADHIAIARNAELVQTRQQVNQILQSRSWRTTAQLRQITLAIRRAAQSPRLSVLGRVAAYLGIRSNIFPESSLIQIRDSSLFSSEYYLTCNPDLQKAGVDPARHYLLHGWREHRNPSALFSTEKYLFDNPDVVRSGINPLLHYLRSGRMEGRPIVLPEGSPEIISNVTSENLSLMPNQNLVDIHSIAHHQGLYQTSDPSVADTDGSTINLTIDAEVQIIKKSGLFDVPFYLAMNQELGLVPDNAVRHYCEYGWREGRDPSVDFDSRSYLASYSDIRNAGLNPFWHYIVAGASELRHAAPDSATRYENEIRFGMMETDIKLVVFYSSPDWKKLRSGRSDAKGQRQVLLPHEKLGFYDSLDARTLMGQAQMAKRHGLHGFCFEIDVDGAATSNPVDFFLANDDIDFRFCVQVKLCSEPLAECLVAFIVRTVSDRRFIHLKGRPVIIVTIPYEKQQATIVLGDMRRRLAERGVDNPFLIGRFVSASEERLSSPLADMADLCDAVLDLPSDPIPGETGSFLPVDKSGTDVVPYNVVVAQGIVRTRAALHSTLPLFHCVTLGRDNSNSMTARPLVYSRFHVRDYRRWLDAAISGAKAAHPEDRRFVFINGWNNWNEGLFLEPDRQGGFGRVNETTRALLHIAPGTSMPKISVIVPNYNHERFLRRRLNSIYGQTYKNIEVILLDDCSSDQSRSILDEYAAANPDITRTLYNETNSGGPFRQWAKGIKAATGELIWIAESDDFCDEQFLEVLARCFNDEAVMLAYAKCVFVNKDEAPMRDEFQMHISELECAAKWNASYVETAHNEVRGALGIKNTIPNASGVLFKRPIEMPLLDDEAWLSMVVAGDWVFYLHIIRGGKIAYCTEATNFFRRYEGSAAEVTYKNEVFYREVGMASQTVATLYDIPLVVLESCQTSFKALYEHHLGRNDEQFATWYGYQEILRARENRLPNVMVSTMGFYPGGAEILPIRLANEFKRQGLSVLLLNAGLNPREDGVRRMLRDDIPLIETSDVNTVKEIIHHFGVEVLNTHQWHIQKYPLQVPDVFDELHGHVASLHGMIEHGDAFGVTEEQLRKADGSVTTWAYTAEKNLVPFSRVGLYDTTSPRFVKVPNGMALPHIVPIPRADMDIPEDSFTLCCVSRAILDKGWAEAILVVERARVLSGRDIRLILVGNGPVHDSYCRVGVPDFVYLAGFSENSVGHYAAADMGIMLTKFKSESFPLTIVDCLFAGKPYIASDVGDIRNMLTTSNDVAGEVIELEDWEVPIEKAAQVVAAFATDTQKYINALALVKDVANRYLIDAVASQYVDLFKSSRDEHRLRSSDRQN